MYKPEYLFGKVVPEMGTTFEVAPGVYWLRMPLPFALNHINLWLLEDGDGWTVVDTGIARDEVKAAWRTLAATYFSADKPLKRIIVTHFHPDHVGLAGWMCAEFGVKLWMPMTEWSHARMSYLDDGKGQLDETLSFYRGAGFDDEMSAQVNNRIGRFPSIVSPIPNSFNRISEGDDIDIGGRNWRIIIGTGHSPEHACLYCGDAKILISGDQVLPRISPNVSVWPQQPTANPLAQFLDSLKKFKHLPDDTLVLPSHDWPFYGLLGRLDDLTAHHEERLDAAWAACAVPATGVVVLNALFHRKFDAHQLFFAIGESLAHIHHLEHLGRVEREICASGIHYFQQSSKTTSCLKF
jgi:glyoxylase-like metal-dependent hydrolase (beta-lactamase superfamily II)